MNIFNYIECINKVFEEKYKDKGFFVVTQQYEKLTFPIFKKISIKIIHIPSNEEVFSFSFQDRVPVGKEQKFENDCLFKIVTTVTSQIDTLWAYGNKV